MNEKFFARIANQIPAPAGDTHARANAQVRGCLRVTEAKR
jgi:hypothetical protein